MSDVPRSLQSWVSTIQTVVLTADVFQLFIKYTLENCRYGRTMHCLDMLKWRSKRNEKQVRSTRCLYVVLLYMVDVNSWINVGMLIQNIRSPRASGSYPPEKMYFPVEKIDDACPGLPEKLCSLCSAAYERSKSILRYWYMKNQSEYHEHTIP